MTHPERPPEDPRDLDAFEAELGRWGRRRPATSGPRAVAHLRRRLEEQEERKEHRGWVPAVALVTGVALVIGIALFAALLPDRSGGGLAGLEEIDRPSWHLPLGPDSNPPHPADPTHPANDGVVLIWLDETTPLYMTFAPPTGAREKGPS